MVSYTLIVHYYNIYNYITMCILFQLVWYTYIIQTRRQTVYLPCIVLTIRPSQEQTSRCASLLRTWRDESEGCPWVWDCRWRKSNRKMGMMSRMLMKTNNSAIRRKEERELLQSGISSDLFIRTQFRTWHKQPHLVSVVNNASQSFCVHGSSTRSDCQYSPPSVLGTMREHILMRELNPTP